MYQRGQDGVQNAIKILAGIFCQEAQDEVPVTLEQGILSTVVPVRLRISQVLRAIQLNDNSGL